ncbi:hypothetical protein LF845_00220 [Deferribacterales bacterium Es71-Z0220]|uniref:flagellin N-terminal helical domain-containing protein n=1 Tax=Deferrivibrio essentukiensis TaxID=2880922 RepID=UPI001F60BA15|nr:flagellin [Deferrivibrio essentukiensis]MCB4203379.1 hypothetical protein [Deferrivibrio essentukiensis]
MRVTFNLLPFKYMSNLEKSLTKLTDSNEKVTVGRTLLKPEESPINYVSAINVQRTIDEADQFKSNAENALSWITNTDNELQRAIDLLSQAKNQYAIAGANDSQSATSRKALAGDVINILDSMVDIGNANYMGRYLFAGFETETTPFTADTREISSVSSDNSEVEVYTRKVFGDMPEPDEGAYSIYLNKDANTDVVTISVYDKNNNILFLDSNGSDETAKGGNRTSTSISVKFEPGKVINTGLGFAVKLPESDFTSSKIDFYFKPGDDIRYHGDLGKINTKIGYNQEVTLNLTGKEVFLEADRVLKSTRYNTVKGLGITSTTKFSQIDSANLGDADYIDISGTDHYGYKVGAAKLLSVNSATLDMTDKNDSERSVLLKYAGKDYLLTMDKRAYQDMDDVIFSLNRMLETNGLGNEIEASADGDKILFSTTRAGNMVNFELYGSRNNTLGFEGNIEVSDEINLTGAANVDLLVPNSSVASTVNFSSIDEASVESAITTAVGNNYSVISPIYTSSSATFRVVTYDPNMKYEVKGKDTRFEINYDDFDITNKISVDFTGVSASASTATEFIINGEKITFTPVDENSDGNIEKFEIKNALDNALKAKGLNFNLSYEISNVSVSANATFDIKFNLENINYGSDSYLAVSHNGTTKFDNAYGSDFPVATEKRVGDLLDFIEELYGYTVKASIENGNIYVRDLRSGESKFTLRFAESNKGLGYPEVNRNVTLLGKYNGNGDDTWRVTINQNAVNPTDLDVTVIDAKGGTILTKTVTGYDGSPIDLGSGVSVVVDSSSNQSFEVSLKANSSFSLGDMNIVQEGKNVDIFRSLKNLYDALNMNIPQEGIGAPSAWRDESLKSTASPYLDGTFRGNYNDEWTYEVQPVGDKTEFFIQQELSTSSVGNLSLPSANPLDFDVLVSDNSGNVSNVSFNILAGGTSDDLLNAINKNPTLLGLGIKAEVLNNKLVIKSGSGLKNVEINANDSTTAAALGLGSSERFVYSKQTPVLELENTTDLERTLTFKYFDGTNWNNKSVTVDGKKYNSIDELANEINSKIAGSVDIVASNVNGNLAFNYDTDNNNDITNLILEGDYAGTLGYFKPGDEVKIKVSGSSGELINYVSLNTAGKLKDVGDGVKLAFDAGKLYTADSFTSTVGSGINYEIPVLDKAETQITTNLTLTGTRQNRVDSLINFHTTISTSNEEIKAKYLGATEIDMTKAITEFQLAQQAYQMAMSTAAKVLQMSIMDYL